MPRGNHPLSSAATLPDQVLALLLAYPDRYNVHDFKGLMSAYKTLGGSASSPPRSSPGSLYKVHTPSAKHPNIMQANDCRISSLIFRHTSLFPLTGPSPSQTVIPMPYFCILITCAEPVSNAR